MSKMSPIDNNEIDLLSLIQTIWNGKWIIAFIISVSLLSVFSFNIVKPNTTFTASTEIKPITSFEFDKYSLFNSSLKIISKEDKENKELIIFEITKKSLLNLYVENIEEGSLLATGINKFSLINKDDFDNERDFKDAIEKFASEIEVVRPINAKKEVILHHVLRAKYDDEDKWIQLLSFVNNEANKKVKAFIINRFATIASIQNQNRDFAIKDIEIKINNVKEDYNRNTKDRLAFLAEQATIARRLGIENNISSDQRFNAQNTFGPNIKTNNPFYTRGFLAIEEEIKLISSRKNKNSFIKELYELEQQKRDLEQNKTIERAINLFSKTPLKENSFQATIVKVATTDFEHNSNIFNYVLAIIFGGVIGVMYVLIGKAFRNRKNHTVNT